MLNSLVKLFKDEEGQGLVEYALILVLIAIVVIAALRTLGGKVNTTFTNINTQMT
jgi:pilus assembly protein Flp/PilA